MLYIFFIITLHCSNKYYEGRFVCESSDNNLNWIKKEIGFLFPTDRSDGIKVAGLFIEFQGQNYEVTTSNVFFSFILRVHFLQCFKITNLS